MKNINKVPLNKTGFSNSYDEGSKHKNLKDLEGNAKDAHYSGRRVSQRQSNPFPEE
ncbi:hypothetical protein [Clostridium intestinale]|uniref:Uncharacterized protein n=1 Tax=Clostridium intestinale DSM 6191 TaxID=1121320 RepID=A0A1M5WCK2_9CLOT|nr:hypothetical protein [Clostridium intestinale]SHH84933.1 hypothetical protein SAMN02745941_01018 [Clostridium intestinale DSM 6191]